jgi:hypothetical protein
MMKNLRNNWNKPKDVGVILNGRKQTRCEKGNRITKCTKWTNAKRGPPKRYPWQVLMED